MCFMPQSLRSSFRSEGFHDGIDVVFDHFSVGIDRGAIGDECMGEFDTGVLGNRAENFRVGLLFRENGCHLMFFEIVDQFAEFSGVGVLLAIYTLHGKCGEAVVFAEVTEGIMGSSQLA